MPFNYNSFLLKVITAHMHSSHLINIGIVHNFQSAYKAGHSCETDLLRVYNNNHMLT